MTLPVASAYDIRIGPLSGEHFDWLRRRNYPGLIVLTDSNTRRDCLPHLEPLLEGFDWHLITVGEGERNKTIDTCQYIWTEMFRAGATRRWCTLNLGGGVLTDMGGFCAATYKRGMDFLQLPTTLLSQVDASVGGKLGIDFHRVKNSIGCFADPIGVWCDPAFYATLPPRELRSGFAEVIKHALIASPEQWHEIRTITDLNGVDWPDLLSRSVAIKRDIVLEDPYEYGLRKALNFGHTIGHAVESHFLDTDARLLHGEAIALGMIAEAYLSHRQSGLPAAALDQITTYLLDRYGHVPLPPALFPDLIDLMRQDKKNEDARINFTLLEAPGKAVVNRTSRPAEITEALEYYGGLGE